MSDGADTTQEQIAAALGRLRDYRDSHYPYDLADEYSGLTVADLDLLISSLESAYSIPVVPKDTGGVCRDALGNPR